VADRKDWHETLALGNEFPALTTITLLEDVKSSSFSFHDANPPIKVKCEPQFNSGLTECDVRNVHDIVLCGNISRQFVHRQTVVLDDSHALSNNLGHSGVIGCIESKNNNAVNT